MQRRKDRFQPAKREQPTTGGASDVHRIAGDPAQIARKAQTVFEKINGGPFERDEKAIRKQIMGTVKAALKEDPMLARELIKAFSNPTSFFPNRFITPSITKGNGGIIAVNTFPLLCQNNHLKNEGGRWVIEESTNTVGGDPTMTAVQAALLGWKTNMVTITPDDKLGHVYVDRMRESGVVVHPIWVKGKCPIQFNFAHQGAFMGGIRLRKIPPIPLGKIAKLEEKLVEVLDSVSGKKIVLAGGASNSKDNQHVFGQLLGIAKSKDAVSIYDPKDSHIGEPPDGWVITDLPLVRNLMYADVSKPNEGETYILEQLLSGRRDLDNISSEARDTRLQTEYWENSHRLVQLYVGLRGKIREITSKDRIIGTMIFTLGGVGVVTVPPNLKIGMYQQPPTSLLTGQGLSLRSPQGGGDAFLAGVMIGCMEEKGVTGNILKSQEIGLLSTHQLGNGCALPNHINVLK